MSSHQLTQPWRARRRPHHKSRAGCEQCRKRKVKCNEAKPLCESCDRFALSCTYPTEPNEQPQSASHDAHGGGQQQASKRGRPRRDWASTTTCSTPLRKDKEVQAGKDDALRPSSVQLNVVDFELYHNFVMNSSQHFGYPKLWREKVPEIAFKVPCILHLMLAFSALHMAMLRPEESRKYEAIADEHYASGVPIVTQMMENIGKENAPTLFIASNLICISTFARRPAPGHLLVISEGTEVPWLNLFRGVRFVIETMGPEAIFAPLGTMGACFQAGNYEHLKQNTKSVSWQPQFRLLSVLVLEPAVLEQEAYRYELESLKTCFSGAFGTSGMPREIDGSEFKSVMRWLYELRDDYIVCLRQKHGVALILLGHFAVALRSIEVGPFGRGWSWHILNEIKGLLGVHDISWLNWPLIQLEEWDRLGASD